MENIQDISIRADFHNASQAWLNAQVAAIESFDGLAKTIDALLPTLKNFAEFDKLSALFPFGSRPYNRIQQYKLTMYNDSI